MRREVDSKSKASSVAPSQSISQRGDFTQKSKVDFPDYKTKVEKKFVDQPKDMYRDLNVAETAARIQKMEVYIKNLLENDHPSYVRLTELSHLLHSSDLDIRQLGSLRSAFEVHEDGTQATTVAGDAFKAKLESVFSPHRLGEQIISKVLAYLMDSDE